MFQKLLYYFLYCLTIYLPLRIRDLCINFFTLFVGRDYAIKMARKLLKEKSFIGVLPDGNRVFLPLDDFKILPIISEIYFQKIYDVKLTESPDCICDVGAHIGLFTLRISKQTSSKIIAIEPHPVNFKFLVKNISINGLSGRVHALNLALGKYKGNAMLLLSKISRGDSSIKKWHNAGDNGCLTVKMSTLDNILSRQR